jgi:hypothetical protein
MAIEDFGGEMFGKPMCSTSPISPLPRLQAAAIWTRGGAFAQPVDASRLQRDTIYFFIAS